MNTTVTPTRDLATDPQLSRHLTAIERLSVRFAIWLLDLHLRRIQRRQDAVSEPIAHTRDAARRAYENDRALQQRAHDTRALAAWHLGAR